MSKSRSKNFFWVSFMVIMIMAGILKFWQIYHWSSVFLEINDKKLEVLLAKTYAQQYRGLGKRDDLGVYQGMLFVHSSLDKYGIVMRDMRFPIDVVWLKDGEVLDIAPNLQTEPDVPENQLKVYYPRRPANAILELPAGWVEKNGVKIGDRVRVIE